MLVFCFFCNLVYSTFLQKDEAEYLGSFADLISSSYAEPLPNDLVSTCAEKGFLKVTDSITTSSGTLTASQVQESCGTQSLCVLSESSTLIMDGKQSSRF